jgi:type II secretory pathway pseudopilin PulG
MSRRVLLLLAVVVVIALGAATALVVTNQSALADGRSAVDNRWDTLRGALAARYDALGQVATALGNAGAQDRTYTVDLNAELADWKQLSASTQARPAAEAVSANRLEGLATRARVNVIRSARLSRDPVIAEAFSGFDTAVVPPPDVRRYNRAVRHYQDTRSAPLKRLGASVLGFDARPVLVVGPSPLPPG